MIATALLGVVLIYITAVGAQELAGVCVRAHTHLLLTHLQQLNA